MGRGGNEKGCRPRACTGVEEEGTCAAAAATRKVAGPAPTQGEEEEAHGRLRRQRRRLPTPRPYRRGGGGIMCGSGNDKGCWLRTHARSGGGGEPCGFTIAGPVPVEEDEGSRFVTPAGSIWGWWSSAVVAGTAKPYGFVIVSPARTTQPRAGDTEG